MQRVIGHPMPQLTPPLAKIHELDERLSAVEESLALLFDREKEPA